MYLCKREGSYVQSPKQSEQGSHSDEWPAPEASAGAFGGADHLILTSEQFRKSRWLSEMIVRNGIFVTVDFAP
jgi:hypothetical protein